MTHPEFISMQPMPTFVEGMARVLDLGGTLRNPNNLRTPHEADSAAILSDWMATGDDLRESIEVYGKRISQPSTR